MKKQFTFLFILLVSSYLFGYSQTKPTASKEIKPALVVIDIQNAYIPYMDKQDTEISLYMINGLIDLFRKNNFPIIRIYHTDFETGPKVDSEQFKYPASVAIKDSDPMIIKNYPNAFKKTDLDKLLKDKGCNTLFLCGLSSVGCVISSFFGARDLNYNTMMVKDAIFCHNAEYTDNIETIFEAVGSETVKLIVESVK